MTDFFMVLAWASPFKPRALREDADKGLML